MRSSPGGTPVLEARAISKSFPGVRALDEVSLALMPGEILAVCGENGAGKSTLMNCLSGIQQPDSGEIILDGEPVAIGSTREAMDLGIALIHQELNLADNLDASANIFLGREPHRHGLIDRRRIQSEAASMLDIVGADFGSERLVATLRVGEQQLVEIAKALSLDARILIMDEPTSSLSDHEASRLFDVMRDLTGKGVSIVYISHRLGEIEQIADRVMVMRDGRNSGELPAEEIAHKSIVQLMVGRDITPTTTRPCHATEEVALEALGLVVPEHPDIPLNFRVRRGEILGIAGLVGAGRSELMRVLFGLQPALAGSLRLSGSEVSIGHPRDAIDAGMALVPEDRKMQGLFLEMAIHENISVASLHRRARSGLVDDRNEAKLAQKMIDKLAIATTGSAQIAQLLSGGNQQKVVLARWLALQPRYLLLDEPTRGVDVGARQEIYELIVRLAASGVAVLFASSEMEELLRLSDRVLILHDGRIAGELTREDLSEEAIMQIATGGQR